MGEDSWRLIREAFARCEEAATKIVDTERAYDDLTAFHLLLFDLEIAVKNAYDEAVKERERRWEIHKETPIEELYAKFYRRGRTGMDN